MLVGFGVVALVLVAVTRGRLGYQRISSPPDGKSGLQGSIGSILHYDKSAW